METIRDPEIAMLYARALLAIARSDAEIGLEESMRLNQRIAERCDSPIRLEDLLFEKTVKPEELSRYVVAGDPYRETWAPTRLGEWLIEDSLFIVLAKGTVTPQEAHALWRFADTLGVSRDDFVRLTSEAARWFPDL